MVFQEKDGHPGYGEYYLYDHHPDFYARLYTHQGKLAGDKTFSNISYALGTDGSLDDDLVAILDDKFDSI